MKMRNSCLVVALAVLGCGTMAHANIQTITQTLYYTSVENGSTGVAGATPNFTVPSAGCQTAACTGLLGTDWAATYTFNQYGFYATGFALSSASVSVTDYTVADVSITNTSGSAGYLTYTVGADDKFSLNPTVTNGNKFFLDSIAAAASAVQGSPGANCNEDNPTNGGFDSTGCLYLTAGSNSDPKGFKTTTGTTNTGATNLPTSSFTGLTTVNIYESVAGTSGAVGGTNSAVGHSFEGSKVVVTYTYDDGQGSTVPEPATLLLLGSGLSFLGAKLRRRSA